jgi:putative ABC transport system ATP-binding protein
MNTVEIKNIKFNYPGSNKTILDISELYIKKNEKVFLFGPSGCGKTTLLETLAGILIPQSGSVNICDTNIGTLGASERDIFRAAKIGYIFQSFNLIPYLSVYENITLPLYLSPNRRKNVPINEEKSQVEFICKELGIESFIEKSVTELSIGQQQRVAAARALLGKPELILADEPTSALDSDHREKFIKLLFQLCKKTETAVLFVSHDKSLQNLFDRSVSLTDLNKAIQI